MRPIHYNAAASRRAETMSALESLWRVPLSGCSSKTSKPGRLFEKPWLAVHDDPNVHLRTSETRQYVRQLNIGGQWYLTLKTFASSKHI